MAQTPTRLNKGVSTDTVIQPLGMFTLPNPNKACVYSNDFNTYLASDWTVVAGGAGSSVALSGAYGAGGYALITTATSGTESIISNPSFNITPTTSGAAGYQSWFEARVVLDATVANPDYALGWMKGTPGLASPTDGIYFTKATTATVWSLVIKAAAGSTTTIALPATTVPLASQVVDLAWYFDGKATYYIYFNKACIGTVVLTGSGLVGSLGFDGGNTPASTILMGAAAANVFHTATSVLAIDYIFSAVETAGR